jgi:hypothetical protein
LEKIFFGGIDPVGDDPDVSRMADYRHQGPSTPSDNTEMRWTDLTDDELMLAYARGEGAAFEALYRRHEGRLFRFVRRVLGSALSAQADEIFQDTWMKIIAARARFEPGQARWTTWGLCHCAQHLPGPPAQERARGAAK